MKKGPAVPSQQPALRPGITPLVILLSHMVMGFQSAGTMNSENSCSR